MEHNHARRLEEAFNLALDDLKEANTAAQICWGFHRQHEQLADEPLVMQQVWGFVEQAVCWKLALALARLTQNADRDRASLQGLIREINAARENGMRFADENQIMQAEANLETARAAEICRTLRNSRNAFIGHTLIGQCREGVRVMDLIEYIDTLESIAETLHLGVYGTRPDFDTHIENWQEYASAWFERVLLNRDE